MSEQRAADTNSGESQENVQLHDSTENKLQSPEDIVKNEQDIVQKIQDASTLDTKCGLLCYPNSLQFMATPRWALLLFSAAAFLEGAFINGLVDVALPSLERQFQISNADSALVSSAFNFGSLVFLLPVTFYSGTRHRPRFMAVGTFFMGIGALIYVIPQFISNPYTITQSSEADLCVPLHSHHDNSSIHQPPLHHSKLFGVFNIWHLFLVAQFINGAATTPFFTCIMAYFHDNMPHHSAAKYISYYSVASLLGPAFGFVAGGQFSQHFNNPHVDVAKLGITPESPIWVGLWWPPICMIAVACFIICIPIAMIPKQMSKTIIKTWGTVIKEDTDRSPECISTDIDKMPTRFLPGFKSIAMNANFVIISLAVTADTMLGSGLVVVAVKLYQILFYVNANTASIVLGVMGVLSAGIGTLLGGYFISKLKLNILQTINMCLIVALACYFAFFGFLIHCPQHSYKGVDDKGNLTNTVANCSEMEECSCTPHEFFPVCGIDGIMYTSSCAAGCTKTTKIDGITNYMNCGCVDQNPTKPLPDRPMVSAYPGYCVGASCNLFYIFTASVIICMFGSFFKVTPAITITVSVVPKEYKSFAMGVQWLIIRALGTIPAPVLFGHMVDRGCTTWRTTGHGRGACALFDSSAVSFNITVLLLGINTICVIFYVLLRRNVTRAGITIKNVKK